jgi:hypothetical protein
MQLPTIVEPATTIASIRPTFSAFSRNRAPDDYSSLFEKLSNSITIHGVFFGVNLDPSLEKFYGF